MLSLRTWRSFRLTVAMLTVVAAVPVARASVIQPTASLPPAGVYTAGTICVPLGPGACIVGAGLGNFTGTSSMINSMGQAIDSSVTMTAGIYSNNGGVPGTFLGNLMLGGPIGILYSGRTSDTDLGTFTSTLTELDLTGTFNGHSIEVMLASTPSSGPTTVAPSGGDFLITSFFDVFAEISIDHGAFVPGPPRTFTLTTPEPGSISLLALGLVGVTGELRRRVRAAKLR
jgi:hypothetical protein